MKILATMWPSMRTSSMVHVSHPKEIYKLTEKIVGSPAICKRGKIGETLFCIHFNPGIA